MVLGDLTGPPESSARLIVHLAVAHLAPKLTPPSGDMRGGQEGAVGGSVEGGPEMLYPVGGSGGGELRHFTSPVSNSQPLPTLFSRLLSRVSQNTPV